MMNRFLFLLPLLLLAACGQGQPEKAPLEGAKIGGPFTLVDQDGKTVHDSDFKGKYRLVYFGYTFCPDVCPVDVQKLMLGLKAFEKQDPVRGAKVQPLFITVDPERDTPAALGSFTKAFHPRLIGLTGSPEAIAAVARAYGVYFQKSPGVTPGTYLVDHSRSSTLYGPKGEPIALIPETGSPEEIAGELGRWVK
ncbi:MAG: SCO family protein [Sphingomonadaceae bacterium]